MQPLPNVQCVDYIEGRVRVSSTSTFNMRRVVYSVPSRLMGERLRVRLYDNRLECYLSSAHAITLERVHPKNKQRGRQIDYRHLIGSLARKLMAFYHSELRDDILPSEQWRRLWQQCSQRLAPRQACYLIVGALELAATYDNEPDVATALRALLDQESEPSLLTLQKCLGVARTELPEELNQTTQQHELNDYGDLLTQAGEQSLEQQSLIHNYKHYA